MSNKWLRLILLVIIVSLLGLASPAARTAPLAYNPNELCYGLYWFGLDGDNQIFEPGVTNPYFDPAKPTLIFVHGWQPFLSDNLPNFDFNGTDTAEAWINGGWNVGIFAWNQFSDETEGVLGGDNWFSGAPPQGVLDAEAKIWTPNGPKGMRWRDWNDFIDGYGDPPPGTPSAAELFYQEYVAAMTEQAYTGGIIRIAGHSLGNQMATRLAKLVHDGISAGEIPQHLRPTRVALLDPYWSPDPRSYLGNKRTGEVVREYIAELLPAGTLFEWYWSSGWTTPPEGDANDALKPMVLYAEMDPQYASSGKDKHMAPRYLYFWSYAFDGPAACSGEACLGMDKLMAKMGDGQLAAVLRSDYRWAQTGGQSTATPADDVYTSTQQTDAPYGVTALQADRLTQTVGGVIQVTATVTDNDGPAGDGILVTFDTDWGNISDRAVTSGGEALAQISADVTGTAHISATTRGLGGPVQSTLTVTFTGGGSDCTPLNDAAIAGPVDVTGTLYIDSQYTFNAVITPTDATEPITYTWSPAPLNGQNRTDATYQWSEPGTYTVTLTAENCGGPVSTRRVVQVKAHPSDCPRPLTGAAIEGPVDVTGTLAIDTLYTFNSVITPTDATYPITYTWSPTPTNGQNQADATYQWSTPGTYTITLVAENCGGPVEAVPRVAHVAEGKKVYVYLPLVLNQD